VSLAPCSLRRNGKEPPVQPSKQEHNLFSVMGQKPAGHATALIIAAIEADAECYALHELGFVTVSETVLVSDSVYFGSAGVSADANQRREA
jgi:hypothetical protein